MRKSRGKAAREEKEPLRLDFGAGPNCREGFKGVDAISFPGIDFVLDLKQTPWPWEDESVAEAHASHFLEHLTGLERVQFCNELYRVLVPGGTCQVIIPHWCSGRAYGDFTHQWPPVSEFSFLYLNAEWRAGNAPHNDIKYNPDGYNCNFEITYGYAPRSDLAVRNQEYQQFAMMNYKEVIEDTIATFAKKEMPVIG